jgi:hypothetical protein
MFPHVHWITRITRRRALAAVAAGVLAAPGLFAQQPPSGDLLEQTRRLNQVAALQVEAETRLALTEADRLAATDRAQAAEKLKLLVVALEADTKLGPERRETLLRVVKDRLRVAELPVDVSGQAAKAAIDTTRAADDEKHKAEAAKVKTALESVAALRKDGQVAEAARQAQELLKNHPNNVAVQVLNGVNSTADSLTSDAAVRKEHADSRLAAVRDIEKSAIIPKGDIEFPKDWKEKSARRLKGQALSEEEVKILQALNSPIKAEFRNSKLQDVVDYLSTLTGRAILIDKAALDDSQLNYDTPITFVPRAAVTTRNVLRSALGQVGLTYVVRDNVIQVTSQARARDMMVTKSYYVGDIVAASGLFGGAPQWGLALDQAQLAQNVGGIVEMIKNSVDPMSWQGQGGQGSIGFNIPTMSLIIRQSAEVHAVLRGGLLR